MIAPALSLVPPAPPLENLRLEQALVGALMTRVELCKHVPATFSAEHYADPWHQQTHSLLVSLAAEGMSGAAGLLVQQKLRMADADKGDYLGKLYTAAVGFKPSMIVRYAEQITDLWTRRIALEAIEEVRTSLHSETERSCEAILHGLVSSVEHALSAAGRQSGTSLRRFGRPREAIERVMAAAEAARLAGSDILGLPTGYHVLDQRWRGMQPGQMIVLAGRPGMGKTGLVVSIAYHVAKQGKRVGIFSLEMTEDELTTRAISAESGVATERIARADYYSPAQAEKVVVANMALSDLPLLIDDTPNIPIESIALRARGMQRELGGLDLVVIDHMHRIKPDAADVKAGGSWAIGRISAGIKGLAKELGCPVIALAQLNRAVEGRDDKRPSLADLRQAGNIEEDADVVAFVYRAEYYLGSRPETPNARERPADFAERQRQWDEQSTRLAGVAEVITAKGRSVRTGTDNMHWDGPTQSFREIGSI